MKLFEFYCQKKFANLLFLSCKRHANDIGSKSSNEK